LFLAQAAGMVAEKVWLRFAASIISEHFQVGAKISEGVILSEAKNLCVWRVFQRRFFASLRMTNEAQMRHPLGENIPSSNRPAKMSNTR
jgi:hypothetical protein